MSASKIYLMAGLHGVSQFSVLLYLLNETKIIENKTSDTKDLDKRPYDSDIVEILSINFMS